MVLARLIANAYAWIGSSLHGRIISAAYGVPRVSLDKPKVNTMRPSGTLRCPIQSTWRVLSTPFEKPFG